MLQKESVEIRFDYEVLQYGTNKTPKRTLQTGETFLV